MGRTGAFGGPPVYCRRVEDDTWHVADHHGRAGHPGLHVRAGHAKDALVFTPTAAPADDAAKRAVTASPEVTVDGAEAAIGYRTLLRTGQTVGAGVFGQILDVHGKPILGKDGAAMVSPSTDFSSILEKDGQLYVVSHFETRPAAVYVTKVEQADDGMLAAVDTQAGRLLGRLGPVGPVRRLGDAVGNASGLRGV